MHGGINNYYNLGHYYSKRVSAIHLIYLKNNELGGGGGGLGGGSGGGGMSASGGVGGRGSRGYRGGAGDNNEVFKGFFNNYFIGEIKIKRYRKFDDFKSILDFF
jgi:hypothetical protein